MNLKINLILLSVTATNSALAPDVKEIAIQAARKAGQLARATSDNEILDTEVVEVNVEEGH